MPADRVEIEEAKEEGVRFETLVAPVRILAEDGRVTGLECRRMQLGEPDASGRRRPEPVPDSEFVIPCDAIVPAIGQVCAVDEVVPEKVAVSKWKTLEVDPVTMQSADPRVFGGGDCYTGPSSLVAALAAGRRAAESIERFLQTGSCEPPAEDRLEHVMLDAVRSEAADPMPFTGSSHTLRPVVVPPDVRIQCFDEVEAAVTPGGGASRGRALSALLSDRRGGASKGDSVTTEAATRAATGTLTIDGRVLAFEPGQTILDVAEAAGIAIPTLCYLPQAGHRDVCRICVVDVAGAGRLLPACSTPATDGMVVETANEHVRTSRRDDARVADRFGPAHLHHLRGLGLVSPQSARLRLRGGGAEAIARRGLPPGRGRFPRA